MKLGPQDVYRAGTQLARLWTRNCSTMSSKFSEFAYGKGDASPPPRQPGTMRLYSMRFCPYAQRTRLLLEHKGIHLETVNVNLKKKPDWLWEMNPVGLVPIIEADNIVVYESGPVNDYLDEVFPTNKLNPADPYLRARDRQLWESMGKMISSFYDVARTRGEDQAVLDRLHRAFTRYEKELVSRGTGPFFGGEKVCMADFMLWPWFERLPIVNKLVPKTTITSANYPHLAAWMDQMYKLPAVKNTMFDVDSHAHFLYSLQIEKNPDYDHGLVRSSAKL